MNRDYQSEIYKRQQLQKKKLSSNDSGSPIADEGPKAFDYTIPDIDAVLNETQSPDNVEKDKKTIQSQAAAQSSESQAQQQTNQYQTTDSKTDNPQVTPIVPKSSTRKVLDDRYHLIKTIGYGRYAKVKLAVDLRTKQHVAVKILKVKEGRPSEFSKYQSLDCLYSEISILADCDHKNIVKIKAVSFDGTIVKEFIPSHENTYNSEDGSTGTLTIDQQLQQLDFEQLNSLPKYEHELISLAEEDQLESDIRDSYHSEDVYEPQVLKRQGPICYYVMNLAMYGDLYRLVEYNERFSEGLVRHLFLQLIEGLEYLHKKGVVHRDIKPENLLIDEDFRLIIADFNFATRLSTDTSHNQPQNNQTQENQNSNIAQAHQKDISSKNKTNQFKPSIGTHQQQKFSSIVQRDFSVGSEAYNAPELWEIEARQSQLRQDNKIIPDELRKYDGIKADIFSAAATLFLLTMKFQPFRRAHPKDPYYKCLARKDKSKFWKIYKDSKMSDDFKDMFEMMICHIPHERLEAIQVLRHQYLADKEMHAYPQDAKEELTKAVKNMEQVLGYDSEPATDENQGQHIISEFDPQKEDNVKEDDEQFEKLRQSLIDEVNEISKQVRLKQHLKISQHHDITILESQDTANNNISHDLHIIKKKSQQKVSMADSSEANASYQAEKQQSQKKSQQESTQKTDQQTSDAAFKQMLAEHLQQQPPCQQAQPSAAPNQSNIQHQPTQKTKQNYHSDEDKSQGSEGHSDEETIAHYSRRARRTSSYSRMQSFDDEE